MSPNTVTRSNATPRQKRWAGRARSQKGRTEAQGSFLPMNRMVCDFGLSGSVAQRSFLSVITSIIFDDEAGVYVATVPSLPGCVGEGETLDQAMQDIRDGISQVLEAHEERGTTPEFAEPTEYVEPSSIVTVHIKVDDPQPESD